MYCHRHTLFNQFCRDCQRTKYEQQEADNDATGYSKGDDGPVHLDNTLLADVLADTAATTANDTPAPDFGGGDFGGAGAGGDY